MLSLHDRAASDMALFCKIDSMSSICRRSKKKNKGASVEVYNTNSKKAGMTCEV